MGLSHVTLEGGLCISGGWGFPEGMVLSTPIYTVYRDPKSWGNDATVKTIGTQNQYMRVENVFNLGFHVFSTMY